MDKLSLTQSGCITYCLAVLLLPPKQLLPFCILRGEITPKDVQALSGGSNNLVLNLSIGSLMFALRLVTETWHGESILQQIHKL